MPKPRLKLVSPTNKNRTVVMPARLANREYRQREYLTPSEVERLIEAARKNRWGHRDATMLLTCYRHGLRASEEGRFTLEPTAPSIRTGMRRAPPVTM